MKNGLLKLITLFVFVSTILYADAGDKRVELLGNLQDSSLKYVTPKYIEKNFETISVNLYNPWEKRKDTYEGVLLETFISKVANANTQEIIMKAIDDYAVTFDKALWSKKKILLVNKVNGKFISIREKGPMRIVFLDHDETNKEDKLNLGKWMWMIKTIRFK